MSKLQALPTKLDLYNSNSPKLQLQSEKLNGIHFQNHTICSTVCFLKKIHSEVDVQEFALYVYTLYI